MKGGDKDGTPVSCLLTLISLLFFYQADKEHFVNFLQALRATLDSKQGSSYILSIACAAGADALRAGYDLPGLEQYVDMFNVMSYGSDFVSYPTTNACLKSIYLYYGGS